MNIHFECTYHFRLTLTDEAPTHILAIFPGLLGRALSSVAMMTKMTRKQPFVHFRDFPRENDVGSFRRMYPFSLQVLCVLMDLTQNYVSNM